MTPNDAADLRRNSRTLNRFRLVYSHPCRFIFAISGKQRYHDIPLLCLAVLPVLRIIMVLAEEPISSFSRFLIINLDLEAVLKVSSTSDMLSMETEVSSLLRGQGNVVFLNQIHSRLSDFLTSTAFCFFFILCFYHHP